MCTAEEICAPRSLARPKRGALQRRVLSLTPLCDKVTRMETASLKPEPFIYPWRWLAGLTLLFVAVHLGYYALGIRFNRDTLIEVMHFLDPELLRNRLLESLWYLHIQPPLMNAFAGAILKVTPDSACLFQAVFLLLGLMLYLCTFLLQLRLGAHRALAALLSFVFMAGPAFILWENYLLYTLPSAAMLALAAVLLFDVLETGRRAAIAGFWAALFILCGMRSMFHLVYFALVFIASLYVAGGYRWRVFAIGAIPFLLLFGFYLKNLLIFREFSVCTFSDKNLWIMTVGNMNGIEKVRLVEAGKLSRLSLVNRWASLDAYPPQFREVPDRFREIPALATTHKSTGAVNYNHYGNIAVCNIYGRDARYVMRHYPRAYFNAVALSVYRYFTSSTDLPVSPHNKQRILKFIALYDYLGYGKSPINLHPYSRLVQKAGQAPCFFLLIGLPLVFLHGLYRVFRSRQPALNRTQRIVVLFLCFNILVVFALGCALDFLETARYRFMTDAFSVALLGLLLQSVRPIKNTGAASGFSVALRALLHQRPPLP